MLDIIIASALVALPEEALQDATIAANKKETTWSRKKAEKRKESECNPTNWTLQARGAAFLPLKQQLRDIYGAALPTVELESSYVVYKNPEENCHQVLLWENVGWTFKTGKTIAFGDYTRLNLIPISIGIEYQLSLGRNYDFYFGVGPTYSFLRIKNNNGFKSTYFRKNQFGFTTKLGFRFTFCTNYFFDVFGDYYYTKFSKMNHNSIQNFNNNFSAFFVGGGFGGKW